MNNKQPRDNERNRDIISFFYQIFGNRVHKGVPPVEARKEAYDAVSLRYGISSGTLLNIISAIKTSPCVNGNAYRQKALSLIDELNSANEELSSTIEKNNRLIELLNESIDGQ